MPSMKPIYLSIALGCTLLASCAVGPNHKAPDVTSIIPAKWKWQTAAPRDAAPKGDWWTIFKDSELDRLETIATSNNQELHAAMARFDQARATSRASLVAYVPDLTLKGNTKRELTSGNQPTPVPIKIPAAQINSYSLPLDLSYELDIWGRIRRSVESAKAETDASASDYNNVLLALTGDVAANYFQLRAFDTELVALRHMQESRKKSLDIIEQKFKAGVVPEVDAARAKSELASTRAEMADVKRQREELVSVLALLCGQPASNFVIAEKPLLDHLPTVPAGLPASLLERRPDIAKAERMVAARSADIGAEIANYFPAVRLTGEAGFLSKDVGNLFSADTRVWSIGPSVSLPITSFFVTKAKVNRAKAKHEEAIAQYRGAVLAAIKDVETSLTQIHFRKEQSEAQTDAVSTANRASELVRDRYEGGAVSYLELLDAERTSLSIERQAAQVKAQRMIATVRLIKALGGKW